MTAEPENPINADRLARTAASQGDWATAASMWAVWRQQNPLDPAGYIGGMAALRGLLEAGMAQETCAKAARQFMLQAPEVTVTEYLHMAGFMRHLQDWDTAARLYAAIRAKWPDCHDAYMGEARCLEQLGQYEQAFYVLSLKLRSGDKSFQEGASGLLAECFRQIGQKRYRFAAADSENDPSRYSGAKVVLVMFAYGEPYSSTAKMLAESFLKRCRFECEVKVLDLAAIEQKPWFVHLENCRNSPQTVGHRGGFYNAWKAYIVRDALKDVAEGDMVYYVDASRHFQLGFYENINTLFRLQRNHDDVLFGGGYAGQLTHAIGYMGDRPELYDALGLADQYDAYMNYPARLNSSFLLKKNAVTMAFAEEWASHAVYDVISLHHTADQAIFSALAYKYGFCAYNIQADSMAQFFDGMYHVWGKDHNAVHRMVNSCVPYYELFRDPRRPEFWPGNLAICV